MSKSIGDFSNLQAMAFYNDLKVGILGGGQLGRMLIQAAIEFNLHISVLDPSPEAPCRPYAHHFEQGALHDYETVMAFGKSLDLITIEIENVNADALADLKAAGKQVFPDPEIIRLIQDKRAQKQFFAQYQLPTATFHLTENRQEVEQLKDFLPAVQKLARAGYDGRGVQVIKSEADLAKAFDAPGLLESFVDFEKEIALIVARNAKGEVRSFPLVEMVFHPEHNLVEYLLSPAELSERIEQQAIEIGKKLADALDYVGLMAIEMFVDKAGKVLINEVAPRPHNSGHHSIRANATSQYEQHLRAILNLPLGSTRSLCPAAMVNLLGDSGYVGPAQFEGLEHLLAQTETYPHIYGKAQTKPFRKMGHITILDQDIEALKQRIQEIRKIVRVRTHPISNQS